MDRNGSLAASRVAAFDAALAAAGAGLADVCWRVICAGEAMQGAERALGWPVGCVVGLLMAAIGPGLSECF